MGSFQRGRVTGIVVAHALLLSCLVGSVQAVGFRDENNYLDANLTWNASTIPDDLLRPGDFATSSGLGVAISPN